MILAMSEQRMVLRMQAWVGCIYPDLDGTLDRWIGIDSL
jgi:hypothetical protein